KHLSKLSKEQEEEEEEEDVYKKENETELENEKQSVSQQQEISQNVLSNEEIKQLYTDIRAILKWYPRDLNIPSEYVVPNGPLHHDDSNYDDDYEELDPRFYGYRLGENIQKLLQSTKDESIRDEMTKKLLNTHVEDIQSHLDSGKFLRSLEFHPRRINPKLENVYTSISETGDSHILFYNHCSDVQKATQGLIIYESPFPSLNILNPNLSLNEHISGTNQGFTSGTTASKRNKWDYKEMKSYYRAYPSHQLYCPTGFDHISTTPPTRSQRYIVNSTSRNVRKYGNDNSLRQNHGERLVKYTWEDYEIKTNLMADSVYELRMLREQESTYTNNTKRTTNADYDDGIIKITLIPACIRLGVCDEIGLYYTETDKAKRSRLYFLDYQFYKPL
ncbi:MAG: hypothetical protein ACTSUE_16815, partial [Promethearchaeota archaeon]